MFKHCGRTPGQSLFGGGGGDTGLEDDGGGVEGDDGAEAWLDEELAGGSEVELESDCSYELSDDEKLVGGASVPEVVGVKSDVEESGVEYIALVDAEEEIESCGRLDFELDGCSDDSDVVGYSDVSDNLEGG